ncbi:ORF6C domain-containing protein [Clostridium cagae]|uniref:ORF6C domain-containing protein n=1 Tax=Clostridium cagae TaxID=2080751 RepID=UPI000CF6F699|nr:ORF6C domain-containing protein [Clostridium cagae]
MNNLMIKGLITVEGMTFHDIEGGFGESKKAMLAKEIAEIHRREVKKVNELINNNRKRFKDNVDIIDLKTGLSKRLVLEMGLTNAQYGNANNIYLLSERGYSKLLKILEDDLAWEQYEKLVDGYFNMRSEIPKMSKELQAIFMIDGKQQKLENEVKNLKDNMPLFNIDCEELQKAVKKKAVKCLGGYNRKAYYDKSLRARVFGDIQREIKRQFEVNSYKAIKRSQLEIAKEIVDKYEVPFVLKDEITLVNNQIAM